MLDMLGKVSGDAASIAVTNQLRTLYRARPFTKSVPFNQVLADVPVDLWLPQNAFFELAKVIIRSDTAAVDLVFLDSNSGQPFLFAMPPTDIYQTIDLDPGYRSTLAQNARLQVWDPSNSGCQVKGILLGWEVTPEGYYR